MTIAARDAGVPVARQILIYPMLDDRTTTPDPHLVPFMTWTHDDNYTAWQALLGQDMGGAKVSSLVVPARLDDHAGLAPAYIEVGELDIVRPGVPHGFEVIALGTELSDRAFEDRRRVITSF